MESGPAAPLWFGLLTFPLMWCAVLLLLAQLGGWRALATSYASPARPSGEGFSFRSGKLGFVNYGSCLSFVCAREGLFVAVALPFRPGHPSLSIPWREVSAQAKDGWIFRFVDLRFAQQPRVRLRLSRSLAERLLSAGGGSVRIEESR